MIKTADFKVTDRSLQVKVRDMLVEKVEEAVTSGYSSVDTYTEYGDTSCLGRGKTSACMKNINAQTAQLKDSLKDRLDQCISLMDDASAGTTFVDNELAVTLN